jgi:hypothetical protein
MAMFKATSIFTIGYIITLGVENAKRYSTGHGIIALSVISFAVWVLWQASK